MGPDQPPLPKPPDDPENLRRLREEARRRMEMDQTEAPHSSVPMPVYGGPPRRPVVTRRWTVRGIALLIAGVLAAIAAALWGYQKMMVPVYGGPPVRSIPEPHTPPNPPPVEPPH